MPRPRSLLEATRVDSAKRAHNCHGDRRHRIYAGDKRLKVRSGRTWVHYCLACARRIVEGDRARLEELAEALASDA